MSNLQYFSCKPNDNVNCVELTWYQNTDTTRFRDQSSVIIACDKPDGNGEIGEP